MSNTNTTQLSATLGVIFTGPVPDLFYVDHLAPYSAGYIVLSAILILLMQLGFAQWETGLSRIANTQNVFMKNLLDSCFCALAFYVVGFGFAFGENSATPGENVVIGTAAFALADVEHMYMWFIQYTFCNNAATIFGGPLAGRTRFMPYVYITLLVSAVLYPITAHWVWARKGFLYTVGDYGSIDFSGGGPVHLLGGVLGLAGAWVVGPRIGFSRSGRKRRWHEAHNKLMAASGAVLLWTGWLAFTTVSGATVLPQYQTIVSGRVACVTLLSGAASAVVSFVARRALAKEYDLIWLANSLMVGSASITAPCAVLQPWAAIVIGACAALWLHLASSLVLRLGIDDPVDAASVHIVGGVWGLLAAGLFADPTLVGQVEGINPATIATYGLFYGGSGSLLGIQLLEVVSITGLTLALSLPLLLALKRTGRLRQSLR